jgi:hypothetical protein
MSPSERSDSRDADTLAIHADLAEASFRTLPEDMSVGVELTYRELQALADALAFGIQHLSERHGVDFVCDLYGRVARAMLRCRS